MWIQFRISIAILVTFAGAHAQELERVNRIDVPATDRSVKIEGHGFFAAWVTDAEIVSYGLDGQLKRTDVISSEVKWNKKWFDSVGDWSVSKSTSRLALVTRQKGVTVLSCDEGMSIFAATDEMLGKKTGSQPFYPRCVALSPNEGRLVVSNISTHFGNNAFLFSEDFNEVERVIGIDALPRKMRISSNGNHLVTLADFDVLNVRDIQKNTDVYFEGKRIEKPRDFTGFEDGPFYSNAFHDGDKLLIFSRDNSWATGVIKLLFLDSKKTVTFDGLNAHIAMDVDFENKRIAVAGTSKNISIFDFDGKKIIELKNATEQHSNGIEFSPSGDKILTFNRDSIWIFKITQKQ